MKILLSHNAEQTIAAMRRIRADQVPYAIKQGIAATALKVKEEERAEMSAVFDRPTPWTMNSLFMKAGTKADPTAMVWLKDDRAVSTGHPASKYLAPQIQGGGRAVKGFELMLQRVGVLPPGWQVVPRAGAKLDAYGNISRGQIVQLLSYFQAFGEQGYSANATQATIARKKKRTRRRDGLSYFVAHPGYRIGRGSWTHGRTQNLAPGIYQKKHTATGSLITPVLAFVPAVTYAPRYAFFEVAERVVRRDLTKNLREAFVKALKTARSLPPRFRS